MTGPEHYKKAEELVERAHHFTYGDGADPVIGAALAAEAQVHATLALAAPPLFGREIIMLPGSGLSKEAP